MLDEYFYYDPESPTGLRWKVDRRSGRGRGLVKQHAGDVAGSLSQRGKYVTKLNGKQLLASRVVWELHNGPAGELVVDHLDGNPLNNLIGNLRLVTQGINAKNKRMRQGNTTGVPGVYWRKDGKAVQSEYSYNGKRVRRTFKVEQYGHEGALEAAIAFRKAATGLLVEQGYTERHING